MGEFTSIEEYSPEEHRRYEEEQKRKRAEEQGALLLDGLGFWVPPLVDVFIGNSAYVWYRLMPDGTGDVFIERYDGASIGEPQTWFEEYKDPDNFWYSMTGSRYDGTRGLSFGLEAGIAPGQPFLMQFGPPHWYRCSYEYNEWDCEYDFEVVRIRPQDPLKSARSFEKAFEQVRRFKEAKERYAEKLDALQRSDIKAMYISQSLYFVERWPDEMSAPTGRRVTLCSSIAQLPGDRPHHGWGRQFFAEEDPESWEIALDRLRMRAERELGITSEQFTNLPKKWRS